MKTLFMGDWQVYAKPNAFESGTDVLDNSLRALAEVFQIASDNECSVIYCTGDVFEHQAPSPYVTNKVIQQFKMLAIRHPSIRFCTITGNHDFAAGTTREAQMQPNRTILNVVEKATSNFEVVDYQFTGLAVEAYLVAIPFLRNENEFLDYVDSVETGANTILLMHQDTMQEIPNSIIDERELAKKFQYVVNGHIHRRKQTGNFITIGSLLQQKGGDKTEVSKGTYIFDSHEGSMTFHEVKGYPVFREYFQGEEVLPEHKGDYIVRRERPVEVKKSLRKLDDTTEKGREHAGRVFLGEKNPEVSRDLETELATLTAKVQGFTAKERKHVRYVSLKVEGYRSWLNGKYDLVPSKLQYIQAATGSGKSSIFEALFWAEFGKLLKEKAVQDDIVPEKWLQDLGQYQGTMVQVVKEVNGVSYTITRCLKYKGDVFGQRGADGFYLHYQTVDGKWLPCDADYFDINAEEFKNKDLKTSTWVNFCGISSEMFQNSVIFTPEKCNLIQSSDADKRALLEPLLGVAWVDQLKELAKAERTNEESMVLTVKSEAAITQERITMAQGALAEIAKQEEEYNASKAGLIAAVQAKVEANKALQPDFEGYVTESKELVAALEGRVDRTITDKLSALQIELDTKQQTLFNYAEEISKLNSEWVGIVPEKSAKVLEVEKKIGAAKLLAIDKEGEARKITQEIEAKHRQSNALTPVATPRHLELTIEYEGLRKKVEDGLAALRESNSRKEVMASTLETKRSTLSVMQTDLGHKSGDCPVCKRALPEGHDILKELNQHKANVALLEAEIARLVEQSDQWTIDHGILMDDANEVNRKAATVLDAIAVEKEAEEKQMLADARTIHQEIKTLNVESERLREWFSAHERNLVLLAGDLETEMLACKVGATNKILAIQAKVADIETRRDLFKQDEMAPITKEMDGLRIQLSEQSEVTRQLDEARKELATAEADLADLVRTIDAQTEEAAKIAATKFNPEEYHKSKREALVKEEGEVLAAQQADVLRREARISNLKQIETQVCGAKGIKAMLIQQKLDRINVHATEYANALGTSIRFYLDDGNNYRCSLMIQGHERDARKASNGQLAVANLIFVGAIKDLVSETVDIGMQMLDEPFGALDPEYIFSISQLLSMQAQKRAMHVITHATELDMTNADLIRIEGGERFPSRFVN